MEGVVFLGDEGIQYTVPLESAVTLGQDPADYQQAATPRDKGSQARPWDEAEFEVQGGNGDGDGHPFFPATSMGQGVESLQCPPGVLPSREDQGEMDPEDSSRQIKSRRLSNFVDAAE